MKSRAKTVLLALLGAALWGSALALFASETATRVDQAERKRMVEQYRAGLKSSPARQKLDSVMVPADPAQGAAGAPMLPDARRVQVLEAEKRALVALTASNEVELGELRARLQLAESERLPVGLIFAMLALLAGCLGGMAFLWRGRRRAPPAARVMPAQDAGRSNSHGPLNAVQGPDGTPRSAASGAFAQAPSLQPVSVADEVVEMGGLEFDKLKSSGRTYSAVRSGALPDGRAASTGLSRSNFQQPEGAVRSVSLATLFDIRQEAGFLLSLGQTEQALRVLERHILENGESSPVIYLDLLDILHEKGLKTQFRKSREEFNLLFNGKVPEYSVFQAGGRDLEGYPHVLAHIMALWPTSKVLMVIEASIYRDPWDDTSAPFDLAAFRELVLLHAIALEYADLHKTAQGAVPGSLVLDLDLTQADAKSEHTIGQPSWGVDFQNTKPGPSTGVGCDLKTPSTADTGANNLIDFELPGESRNLA